MTVKDTQPAYLDFNATTPLDPRVFEAMRECYLGPPANAGSRTHVYGHQAKDAVEDARTKVANVIAAKPEEIIFTSGATESNNLSIIGLAAHGESSGRKHILSTAIEHKAVLEPLEYLGAMGFEIELVPVGSGGFVDPDDVAERCRKDTLLVSVMHANNETGVIQPVKEIGEQLQATETWFHIDAAQTFGKEPDLADIEFDLLSISSHKIYGPQGIGALYVKRQGNTRIPISSLVHGGGQERGLRPGTVPVALAVGFGEASKLAKLEQQTRAEASQAVRDAFLLELKAIEHVVNGDLSKCQDHVVNIRFPGVDSEALMMVLRETLAFSNGSACTSDSYDASHVLIAMGISEDDANESVRFSWGPGIESIPGDAIVSTIKNMCLNF
ncbi:cysteine desulfurase family protein [Rhodopirellula baltica]|uniref:cysteine desulfurase n=1 Tax=Rhodopirellula baltica WH47 TaxID=991778 RepID=F2AQ93_RHOBT|nr:aminotransferase class V-fold PLP-dependent enzyme [Rhodopirellula baltica]EGF28179.1 cysteine desulfurase IscS [Rhodopirellula baltica WH47]